MWVLQTQARAYRRSQRHDGSGAGVQALEEAGIASADLFVAVAVVMPKEEEESIANEPEPIPAETAAATSAESADSAVPEETGDDPPE